MRCNTILDAIGNTPLVQLHRVSAGLSCKLYAKCEFLNPGGSVKDRIGYQMVMDAEKAKRIRPGDTLIEPTSGNTGIGIALAGALRGYRVIITMPEKMSREKQIVLEALGAQIIRTPTEAAYDAPESHIGVAKRLQKELPNAFILDQYGNPSNPDAHYHNTAEEIWRDLDGKIDMLVATAGTGGTITGVAKKLKEKNPRIQIIGADPVGSILGGGTEISSYKVEGIGYDFIPDVLNRDLIDEWIKTTDRTSFVLARRLIREEGLLVGGSSGAALFAALKAATRLKPDQNCVVILPDGVRNYMTKFVDNQWMRDNRFDGPEPLEGTVRQLVERKPKAPLLTVGIDDQLSGAIDLMKSNGFSQIPVIDKDQRVCGLLTETSMLRSVALDTDFNRAKVQQMMERSVPTVELDTPLALLQDILLQAGRAVVIDSKKKLIDIITKIDLVEWLSKGNNG